MMRLTLISSLAAMIFASPANAGPCAVPTIGPIAAVPDTTAIQDGGGVIVTLGRVQGPEDEVARAPTGGVSQDTWRFTDGGRLVKPTIDDVAPGLAVYRLPDSKTATYTLEDAAHHKITSVKRSTDRGAAVLPAPIVAGAGQIVFPAEPRFGGGSVVRVHLIAPPPKGAYALIAYGADGVARSFGEVGKIQATAPKDIGIWHTRGRCETEMPGTLVSSVGDKITLAWLDDSGRVSAKSAPIEIKSEKLKDSP